MEKLINFLCRPNLPGIETSAILCDPPNYPIKAVEIICIESVQSFLQGQLSFKQCRMVILNLHKMWQNNDQYYQNSDFGELSLYFYSLFSTALNDGINEKELYYFNNTFAQSQISSNQN